MDVVRMAILGLGLGGAYALLALGVVAIYRGTGVPNFSQGAVGMFSAYVFFGLRDKQEWPPVLAAVVTLLAAAVAGWVFYRLVMRQLRSAPILARITATIGLLLLLRGLAMSVFEVATTTPDHVLPHRTLHLGGVAVPEDRLIIAGLAIALGVALSVLSVRTRLGLAVRAVADSEKGAQLVGLSPSLLGAVTWGVGFALAALAGILLSPVAGLDADALTLLIVPVFGAALLARFNSFLLAVAGGLGIGMMQAILELFQGSSHWYTELWAGVGRTKAFPALIVILLIVFSGRLLPSRGDAATGRLPICPMPRYRRSGPLVALLVGSVLIMTLATPWLSAAVVTMGGVMIGLSVVLITGFLGQVSLAQFASAGIGGLVAARLSAELPLPVVMIVSALVAAVIGVLLGLPSVRVRGQNLALVTLSATYICQTVIFEDPRIVGSRFGFPLVRAPELLGSPLSPRAFAFLVLVVVIATGALVAALRASSFGRRALAVRENEAAAIAAGTNVTHYKLAGFALSSAIAGLAGCLLSYHALVFAPSGFGTFGSLNIVIMGYIGGIAMIGGAVFAGIGASGGLFAQFLAVNGWSSAQDLIGGLALLIAIQLHSNGIASLGHEIRQRRQKKALRGVAGTSTTTTHGSMNADRADVSLEGLAR
ncbi:ABC transporter permease subunit [Planosporangium sp. 12N6]|uniref:ABC transporter permease subunit n=1 Tax=Planosporangium spinosum TaxID=3402278 RepID=UPI003CEF1E13